MRQFNLIDALIELNLYLIVEDIFLQLDCQSLTNAGSYTYLFYIIFPTSANLLSEMNLNGNEVQFHSISLCAFQSVHHQVCSGFIQEITIYISSNCTK